MMLCMPLWRRSRSVFSRARDGLSAGMMKSSSVWVVVSCVCCVRPCCVCVMMCVSSQLRLFASFLSCCSCCCVSVWLIVAVMSYLVWLLCSVIVV